MNLCLLFSLILISSSPVKLLTVTNISEVIIETQPTGSPNQQASKPWEKGADFNDYLKTNVITREYGDGGSTQVDKQSNALGDLAVRIIKAQFPEYTDHINTKVTAKPAEDGAIASYGGLGGDTVNAGKVTGAWSQSTTIKKQGSHGGKVGDTWTGQGGYLTTDDVVGGVGTILHELYHARSYAIPSYDKNLGKDWKSMLKDASDADFPSVSGGFQNGDTLNEFLASAVTIRAMQSHGIQPTGRFKGLPEKLDEMDKKYPWLPSFIKTYSDPEKIKGEQKPVPPGIWDRLFGSTKKMDDGSQSVSKPWEKNWNDTKEKIGKVVDTVVQKVTPSGGMPWEKSWSSEQPAPTKELPPSITGGNWNEIDNKYRAGQGDRNKSQLTLLQGELAQERDPNRIEILKREIARAQKLTGNTNG